MDSLLITVKELFELSNNEGKLTDFKGSEEMVDLAIETNSIISNVKPQDIEKELRDRYYNHLVQVTSSAIDSADDALTWVMFSQNKKNKKSSKIIFDFGVKNHFFDADGALRQLNNEEKKQDFPKTRVTIEELYELCKINFNFSGSKAAFKRHIQKTYGSYAEYCLFKGYDINATKWEDPKAALRCAKKIGSLDEVKKKSMSLYNYLGEHNLLDKFINDSSNKAS